MQSSQEAAVKAIRLHLAARNKRQTWLALELGVSPFWLSRRMSGEKTFDVDELDRIAAVFDTTIDGLLASAKAVAS
jgi:transcriptional regulator with XRE-family HTH domain